MTREMSIGSIKFLFFFVLPCFFSVQANCRAKNGVPQSKYDVSHIAHQSNNEANDIRSMVFDHRQILWMATKDGLYLLQDGSPQRFSTNETFEVVEDGEGRLWVSEVQGIRILSKDRSTWLPLTQLGLPKLNKQRILIDRVGESEIAIYDAPNLYRYHIKTQRWYVQVKLGLSAQHARKLKYSPKEKAFYLCHPLTLWGKVQGKQVSIIRETDPPFIANDPSILTFKNTDVHNKVSLLHLPGDTLTYVDLYDDFYVIGLSQIEKKTVLIKDKLRELNEIWEALYQNLGSSPKSLPKTEWRFLIPSDVCISKKGTWHISTEKGLFIVKEKDPSRFKTLLSGYSVRGITRDPKGRLLVSTYSKLFRFQDPQFQQPAKTWSTKVTIWDYLWYPNHLYLAVEAEPSLLKITTQHSALDSLETNFRQKKLLLKLHGLEFGRKMIRTNRGFWSFYGQFLIKFDDEGNAKYYHNLNYNAASLVCMLMGKDSSLWLGGTKGLIHVYPIGDGHKIRKVNKEIPTLLKEASIRCLYEDRNGHLWVGTEHQGLFRIDGRTQQIKRYDQNTGLANNTIFTLHGSNNDSLLWLGTSRGLSCLHSISGKIVNYHQRDGLAHEEFNTSSVFEDKDGTLFMGGINGVTYFRPWMPNFSAHTIKPYLTLNLVNLSSQKSRNFHLSPNQKVVIQPGEKSLTVGLHTDAELNTPIRYRYRLSGVDQQWRYPSGSNLLTFIKLSPRSYKLWVSARTDQEGWSIGVPFIFEVRPAWYQTWWFIGLTSIIIATGLYQVHRFRLAQVQKEYQLRKSISNDLHDDLSGRIYALRTIAGEIIRSSGEKLEPLHTHFERLSLDILQSIRDFIWAFNPENGQIKKFIQRLEDFAENNLASIVEELEFVEALNDEEKELDAVTKHHILMVYQELLTNMIKHTQGQKIHIQVYILRKLLCIKVTNTYKELKKKNEKELSEGYGLESIQRRLSSIQAKLIWTETGKQQIAEIQVQ